MYVRSIFSACVQRRHFLTLANICRFKGYASAIILTKIWQKSLGKIKPNGNKERIKCTVATSIHPTLASIVVSIYRLIKSK